MATITIQPGQPGRGMEYDVSLPLPYPFHIDVETLKCKHGRGTKDLGEDPTGVTPWQLLGFQRGDVQEIVLTAREFVANPEQAVGLVPVFIDWRGSIFSTSEPITSAASSVGTATR